MPTINELKMLQALPLDVKILKTKQRIREWYSYWDGKVYVSFSGGKDSSVLLDIARRMYPNIKAMFVDTGLEYPEIRQFVKTYENVDIIRPTMSFVDVITKYGYPMISKEVSECIFGGKKAIKTNGNIYQYRVQKLMGELKDKEGNPSQFNLSKWKYLLDADFDLSNQCCNVMKKKPAHQYSKQNDLKAITGQTAEESRLRTQQWLKSGCNAFKSKNPISNPLSFWSEQDILEYIYIYKLPIASVYGDVIEIYPKQMDLEGKWHRGEYKTTGVRRTGCIFCGFGSHLEKSPNRFELLKETHPKQYNYCINGGEYIDGFWKPNKQGLGMSHILDYIGVKY